MMCKAIMSLVMFSCCLISIANCENYFKKESNHDLPLVPDLQSLKFKMSNMREFENMVVPESEMNGAGDRIYPSDVRSRWPDGIVPYYLNTTGMSLHQQDMINQNMDRIMSATCVKFSPVVLEYDYLYISYDENGYCWSESYYKNRGAHFLSLNSVCAHSGTIMFMLMYALGARPEHNRPDRDDYVTINWSLLTNDYANQFFKHGAAEDQSSRVVCNTTGKPNGYDYSNCTYGSDVVDFGLGYDFNSIMHYITYSPDAAYDYVLPKDTNITVTGSSFLSEKDIHKLNAAYGCSIPNPAMGCTKHLTQQEGYLRLNKDDDQCRYLISVPHGYAIDFEFNQMDVQPCGENLLTIRDGPTSNSPLLGSFCSGYHPYVIRSIQNEVLVEVNLSGNSSATIFWRMASITACDEVVVAVIESTNFIYQYYYYWLGEYKRENMYTYDPELGQYWPVYTSKVYPNFYLAHIGNHSSRYEESWTFNLFSLDPPGFPRGYMSLTGRANAPHERGRNLGFKFWNFIENKYIDETIFWDVQCLEKCSARDIPVVPDAISNNSDGKDKKVDQVITYQCSQGYNLYSRCQEQGIWSQPGDCNKVAGVTTGQHFSLTHCPKLYRHFLNPGDTVGILPQGYLLPNGTQSDYRANLTCTWKFFANDKSSQIKLSISKEDFDVEESPNCGNDFLFIHGTDSNNWDRICGTLSEDYSFTSDKSTLTIIFGSNHDISGTGMHIRVETV